MSRNQVKKVIFKYIFSLSFVLLVELTGFATGFIPNQGIYLGIDLARIIMTTIKNDNRQIELNAGIEYSPANQISAELGFNDHMLDKVSYVYQTAGSYLKVGIDHAFLENVNDHIFGGVRYCYGNFKRGISNVIVDDPIWGKQEYNLSTYKINSHWFELLFGMKTEILRNLYLGWSVRTKFYITNNDDPLIKPLYVPGYGKRNSKIGAGITYKLEYKIPYKKK